MIRDRVARVLLAGAALGGLAAPIGAQESRPFPRWRIEADGAWARLSASDANQIVEADEQVVQHLYDTQLEAMQRSGQIRSWSGQASGTRPRIDSSRSAGLRLSFGLNDSWALSIGVRRTWAGASAEITESYTRTSFSGDQSIETLTYSPYALTATAWAPSLGVHLKYRLGRGFELQGHLGGGPLFARFESISDWQYAWDTRGPSGNGRVFDMTGRREGQGEGTGLAVDVGLRLQRALAGRIAIFVEASYAYGVVRSPSGPGREVRDGRATTWDGEWAIARERIQAPWGTLDQERPTNRWPDGSAGRVRGFDLDLSGAQVRLGLSLGL